MEDGREASVPLESSPQVECAFLGILVKDWPFLRFFASGSARGPFDCWHKPPISLNPELGSL